MLIRFLRHGETEWNRTGRIQGATPFVDLTDAGVNETQRLAESYAAKAESFDRLYTSPLLRARRTAEIIGEVLGLMPIQDDRLREMSFGRYEGTRYGKSETGGFRFVDANIRCCFDDPSKYAPPPTAESFDRVLRRVASFVKEMSGIPASTTGRILVVTHGGVICAVQCLLKGMEMSDFWKGMVGNLMTIEFDLNSAVGRR